jgi:hypothetical protein
MTLPDERYRAVMWAERFLTDVATNRVKYPRVPAAVRREAHAILRHYPGSWNMDCAARAAPDVFQSPNQIDDLQKFLIDGAEKTK